MRDVILKANHLVKTYSQRSGKFGFGRTEVKALNDVSITLNAGNTLAVVGESGSGKSTLARCLLQLQPLDSGEVLFNGQDLAKLDQKALRAARKDLQWCFKTLLPHLIQECVLGQL